MNHKIVYNHYKKLNNNLKSCQILSITLNKIIKYSLNDKFRNHCFKILKTSNLYNIQVALTANLLQIISHNNHSGEQIEMDDKIMNRKDIIMIRRDNNS
jgi:hypothetical protein